MEKNELVWQKALEKFVISKKPTFISTKNKLVNILSLGKHNCFEGPDFLNACLTVDGKLTIGDIEFHKKSSSWIYHKHSSNKNYSKVILHLVFDNDKKLFNENFETVLITRSLLKDFIETKELQQKFDYTSYEDFQKYAIFRLQRRSEDIANYLQNYSFSKTFTIFATIFLEKYVSFRKRPSKNNIDIFQIIDCFLKTSILQKISSINSFDFDFSDFLNSFFTSKSFEINKHLKQEIITNVLLPIMFCVANSAKKSELLLWYWSAKTKTKYGILEREFPLIKQEYIWLQQGMLEFLKEFNHRNFSKESELLINYSNIG